MAFFSYRGRINRTKYTINVFVLLFVSISTDLVTDKYNDYNKDFVYYFFYYLDIFSFLAIIRQNAKRCHDIGKSGWYQVIPLYIIYLFFAKGDEKENQYGKPTVKSEQIVIYEEKANYDDLFKLKDLLDQGIITQEEFETQKNKLLK